MFFCSQNFWVKIWHHKSEIVVVIVVVVIIIIIIIIIIIVVVVVVIAAVVHIIRPLSEFHWMRREMDDFVLNCDKMMTLETFNVLQKEHLQ